MIPLATANFQRMLPPRMRLIHAPRVLCSLSIVVSYNLLLLALGWGGCVFLFLRRRFFSVQGKVQQSASIYST